MTGWTGFFWLHIRKSGGQSARRALGPLYRETDRDRMPGGFITAPRAEWNDILNNHRVFTGPLYFRRSEFARLHLYPGDWESMMRVAFSREPVSRCVSMFNYLINPWAGRRPLLKRFDRARQYLAVLGKPGVLRAMTGPSQSFSGFLDILEFQEEMRKSSVFKPLEYHFSSHTNPICNGVCDGNGNSNMSHIFRLECFEAAIDQCFEEMGVPRRDNGGPWRLNVAGGGSYVPDKGQLRRIERLYERDFEIYESALAPRGGGA